MADGLSQCGTNPARHHTEDTLIYYAGDGWTLQSALCLNAWVESDYFGLTPSRPLGIVEEFAVPRDAFGYCVFDEGKATEVVVYSLCGDFTDQQACEQASNLGHHAEWKDCPRGPHCPPAPTDTCIEGRPTGRSHAMYVDNPAWACAEASGRLSTQDSALVTLDIGWTAAGALCLGRSGYDVSGVPHLGVGGLVDGPIDARGGVPEAREGGPSLQGATGYCSFYEDTVYAFVVFNMCDEPSSPEGEGGVPQTPQQACEQWRENPGLGLREGSWHPCPGSPLCVY